MASEKLAGMQTKYKPILNTMIEDKKMELPLATLLEELGQHPAMDDDDSFPGFSKRLNQLIDMTDLDIPDMDGGRQSYLSNLLNISKMPPGYWLKKDKPPKTSTLRRLVAHLLSHIQGTHNPITVEAWLKYGDVAVPNPFDEDDEENEALAPLATSLIVSVAQEIGIPISKFDLNPVLSSTIDMLAYFKLTQECMIDPVYRAIIAKSIKSHPR